MDSWHVYSVCDYWTTDTPFWENFPQDVGTRLQVLATRAKELGSTLMLVEKASLTVSGSLVYV